MHSWSVLFDRPGFQARLVRRFGLSKQTVNGWRNGIPIPHCAGVEDECGGEFTRKDFRPDDWHVIWPELVQRRPSKKESADA
jgi:DNA-binding transcriptional regulator YdaS (Cro superfamily)